jgi:hypothetical protein
MAKESDLRAVFAALPTKFQKGGVAKTTSFYFSLGDGPGEKWTVTVSPDKCDVKEGKGQGEANCVLKTNGDFFLKMFRDGYTPGATDFMGPWSKAKSNDPMLLAELKKAFKL